MSSKNGPAKGSSIVSIMASVAETASPLLAMTGVGIPLALVLHTCSMGVKMMEDNNKLKETVKKCNTFTLKWSREYIINSVTIQKHKDLTDAFYKDQSRINHDVYKWKYGKIQKTLTQVSMDKVMNLINQLNSYLEYCLNNRKIDNWLTGGLAKKEVIDDLVQEIIVEFSFFEKETLRMKDEVSLIIKMDLDRAKEMMTRQNGGGRLLDLASRAGNFVTEKAEKLSKGELASSVKDSASNAGKFVTEKAEKLSKGELVSRVKDSASSAGKLVTEKAEQLSNGEFADKFITTITDKAVKTVNIMKTMKAKFIQKDMHKEEIYMLDEIYYSILEDQTYKNAKDINENKEVKESEYNSIEEMKNGLVNEINKNENEKIVKLPEGNIINLMKKEKDKNDAIEESAKSNKKWFSWKKGFSLFGTKGGLSTRRKRKRRPKFHQVRSYKQRPKQHRLK